ncbi:MAG: class I SAM-dependent methyltransferase [Clostridia bacterium]|nr:class I SAM-dependent methyltransferase [Clostridia bacterium]
MNTLEALTAYYGSYDEHSRLETRRGQPEFITTVTYIEKYLLPNMKILEVGAGTGRYSHYFAQKGFSVDAVELIEHNIEVFKSHTKDGEPVTVRQGNALDLSDIESDLYDITLLLGPMYHLYTEEEQKQALSEAIRVTKPSGFIFAAYVNSDMTMYQYCFARGMIHHQLTAEKIDPETFKLYSLPEDVFQLYRKEDIDRLISNFKVERLHYIGTDMLTHFIKATVDEMDDDTFDLYMRYHLSICERSDMIGATNHILDIFRKEPL